MGNRHSHLKPVEHDIESLKKDLEKQAVELKRLVAELKSQKRDAVTISSIDKLPSVAPTQNSCLMLVCSYQKENLDGLRKLSRQLASAAQQKEKEANETFTQRLSRLSNFNASFLAKAPAITEETKPASESPHPAP